MFSCFLFGGFLLPLRFLLLVLPNKDTDPDVRVLWDFDKINSWFVHILDGHVHFGSSMLVVQRNELGYRLTVLHKIIRMSLLSKVKNPVFDSGYWHLEVHLPCQG